MNNTLPVLSLTAFLLAGCASERSMVADTVNPNPVSATGSRPEGTLVVFSATDAHIIGDGLAYYPHTGYIIYNERGAQVMYVPNHVGNMDETPQTVALPAGNYVVRAQSDGGRISVPVVVKAFRLTEVRLTGNSKQKGAYSKNQISPNLPAGAGSGWAGSH